MTNNLPMRDREHFFPEGKGEAGVCGKRRQMFVERLVTHKKTDQLEETYCQLALNPPGKQVEGNWQRRKAGDEIRTRDSLLGRQEQDV